MALAENDFRYRARCNKCNAIIGDWALQLPKDKRLCFDHKKHELKDIEKKYGNKEPFIK